MKESFVLFLIAFLVIAATFTSFTGLSWMSGSAEASDLPDNETTAEDVFTQLGNMSSDQWWLSPLLLIAVIFIGVVVFLIIYPFYSG